MTSERWAQIKGIVSDAMELPRDERPAYVERACGTDAALRREVESLLAAGDGPDSVPGAREAIASAAQALASDGGGETTLRSVLEEALGRQYEVLRPLGRGGMGDVYLARERSLERFVAIKVLRSDLASAPDARERFRREARIAAQLSHPGILRLHTFGDVAGVWYFVMGYVRGETLAERLRLEGRLSWTEAHRILTELADALECAHRHGVVHRDIKPANILLDDESGHAVLADFGISKAAGIGDSLTATGAIVGTPDYMSPEQALGSSDVDERSDIYSLGAVAYRMLAGREPFVAASTQELIFRRLSHDPPLLQSIAPSVPDALAAAVMKCLAREPAMRWSDARALKNALERIGSAEAVPEPLRELPSFAPYALLWGAAWTALAVLAVRSPGERALLLLIALLVPVGLVLHVWNVGRGGFTSMELARVASWPPEWWGMWWPRRLRRPQDLWARLPVQARLVRIALSGFFVAVPALIVLKQWLEVSGRMASDHPGQVLFAIAQATFLLGAAVAVTGGLRWARRRLSLSESARLLFGATTMSSFWTSPRIARLLAPATGRVRPPDRDSPGDHHRAIVEALRLLPPEQVDIGRAASAIADRLNDAIGELDRELASLARDASSAETDRLAEQLAGLGETTARESHERRELRELVRHQLAIVQRLRNRHEAVIQARGHLHDLLRGLWTHSRGACDASPNSQDAVLGAERLRSLCVEIGAELDAQSVAAPTRASPVASTGGTAGASRASSVPTV